MNPTEQKKHHTAITNLAEDAGKAFEAVADGMDILRKEIGEERTHRLKLAEEQRNYVDSADRALRVCCQERWDSITTTTKTLGDRHAAFAGRGFWSRLNWLLTGR